ncbi:SRPBCC domain-containing protein [Sphingobacterium sp. JB170]|uniref:SRPBCC family protein n=1 Tax=Sphingobacterium sp. JB170 TaxID=1434842 RepID=UPI00097ECACC|nr:SRPBCC domain-containing protein [Sphingobacterium sp. JB170]SJN18351.1 Probable glutathione S-transferase-related transmembrane protein [Sphingobacterium sp. JB170]
MEQKTKVNAEDGKQEILIIREFDLPLELLFKAYQEPELFEQWMETKVLKMENKKHGFYAFETSRNGNVVFRANGTIHEFVRLSEINYDEKNTFLSPLLFNTNCRMQKR